jgi:catechol 2,3-dioxygenase-like lactoylglutathione lyase family enzyme
MIQTSGIAEISLTVENMEAMVCFYRDILGLRVRYPQNVRSYRGEPCVYFWAGACILALRTGSKQPAAGSSSRIIFSVRDIEHAHSYLLSRDIPVGDIRISCSGEYFCDGLDPEGNEFSLAYQPVFSDVPSQVIGS